MLGAGACSVVVVVTAPVAPTATFVALGGLFGCLVVALVLAGPADLP
jgi:hypothetical protein